VTDVDHRSRPAPRTVPRWLTTRWALWCGFVVTHLWLAFVSLNGDRHPLGDVTLVYLPWMQHGFATGHWVGLDLPWVYPILALLPMLLAFVLGPADYAITWLVLVMVLDAVAFGFLIGWRRPTPRVAAAWWWLGFLVLLGPIAVSRLDTVTVPFAIVGLLFVASRPRVAAAILTTATWIKVWPAALVLALVVAAKARWRILIAAVVSSAVIACVAVVLGGGSQLLSFVSQQSTRGLQIEAPVSTLWLWQAFAGVRHAHVYYDTAMLTFQVDGDGAAAASALMTPLLGIVIVTIVLLAVLRVLGHAPTASLLPALSLALITAFIAFNKVGSPQYLAWLAAPIVLGLVLSAAGGTSFRVPAILGVVLAALTQVIYPWFYDGVLALDPLMLFVLTVRNLLLFVLLGWAVTAVWTSGRENARTGNAHERDRLEDVGHIARRE